MHPEMSITGLYAFLNPVKFIAMINDHIWHACIPEFDPSTTKAKSFLELLYYHGMPAVEITFLLLLLWILIIIDYYYYKPN